MFSLSIPNQQIGIKQSTIETACKTDAQTYAHCLQTILPIPGQSPNKNPIATVHPRSLASPDQNKQIASKTRKMAPLALMLQQLEPNPNRRNTFSTRTLPLPIMLLPYNNHASLLCSLACLDA